MSAKSKPAQVRHVLGISGGKDSAALAIYLKQQGRVPEMEYFFTDTGAELPEVYSFVDKLEAWLGKPIVRLGSGKNFTHHLKMHNGMLPSPKQRWCTRVMKIEPFEEFVGDSECITYIGIRADEFRDGYLSLKPNIKAAYPFIADGLVRKDIFDILRDTVGIPEYYEWRSRSGCFFCFFQRRDEWVRLAERHPEAFERAAEIEKKEGGNGYTWVQGTTLHQLLAQKEEILKKSAAKKRTAKNRSRSWQDILIEEQRDDENQSCLICSL